MSRRPKIKDYQSTITWKSLSYLMGGGVVYIQMHVAGGGGGGGARVN